MKKVQKEKCLFDELFKPVIIAEMIGNSKFESEFGYNFIV